MTQKIFTITAAINDNYIMATTIEATTSSSSTCLEEESSELRREKQDSIQRCLDSNPIDLWRLRELALTRGGLVNGTKY